ncbi:MAG: hypothetical protein RI942_1633 [Pseudomonadota bacterium]
MMKGQGRLFTLIDCARMNLTAVLEEKNDVYS